MPDRKKIPKNTASRLSLYLREVTRLEQEGRTTVSSIDLGESTGLTDAQVRKDLSYFGQFGVSGTGYEIPKLKKAMREILGKQKTWPIALVGVGNIGSALLRYPGFKKQGFIIKEAFDSNPKKIGTPCGDVVIKDIAEIYSVLKNGRNGAIKIAILAVPSESAQGVADRLQQAGVKTILNFAPVVLKMPDDVVVSNIDLASELENFSFILTFQQNRA